MVVSQKITRVHSKKSSINDPTKVSKIYEKLYNERNMYFERKRSQRNSQIEE